MAAPMLLLKNRLFHLHRHHMAGTCAKRLLHYMKGSKNILKLHERGILHTVFPSERSPDLYKKLVGGSQCFYCGFDPTADSLHIGNLLAIIALLHCQRAGHQVIAVLGGATSQIGDPSGKSKDRPAMTLNTIDTNITSIEHSLQRIFTNHSKYFVDQNVSQLPAKILDNREWYEGQSVLKFLSTVGRYFRMGTMLSRESVKSRVKSPEGMSWTEFSYQVFQAYDWLHLYKKYKCNIQIGGNDQLGNITSGYELVQRVTNEHVYGVTVPLVTSTTGDKLGKTAGNAVWLNADKTSPYHLYQFYINIPDSQVETFLKQFTFIHDDDIDVIMRKHKESPEKRSAQKVLAEQVVLLVHGENGVTSAIRCTEALFSRSSSSLLSLSQEELNTVFSSASTVEHYLEPGTTLLDAVMMAGCFSTIGDAERVIAAGGVYVNHSRESNPNTVLSPGQHILPNHITLLRVGKKNYYLIRWQGAGVL